MASDGINYNAVLQDLRAKRTALDAAITAVEQVLSVGAIEPEQGSTTASGYPESAELRKDSFFGLTIPDAIRKALRIAKQPLSLSELTTNLKQGGMLSNAGDLMRTVSATLTRMKKTEGDVVQVQGGWALRGWYPGMRKEKVEATAKPKKRRRRAKPDSAKETRSAQSTGKHDSTKPTPEQIDQMKVLHAAGKKFGQIAKELGISTLTVWRTLKADSAVAAAS